METTLVLVKPDGVQRHLVGRILARFEEKGLQVVGLRMMCIPEATLRVHYAAHKGKPFYEGLIAYMSSGPVVAVAIRGPRAIGVVRTLMGKTFGHEAAPGTIRGDLGLSGSFNLVHGSDSPEAAKAELALYFKPEDLCEWRPLDLDAILDPRDAGDHK
ncbi:MAG: nucleoside-diphosphate kinase [Planctomycetales bacterium]|nr:nucleoside-diphosphate kinase [Planctomycetales bacterium]